MTNLRVWVDMCHAASLSEMQGYKYSCSMTVANYPLLDTDICYELVPVSREVLEREAAEGIKQIDEEKC